MRCLYEVLAVERDADEATIKSAYRKAALKWHPDKNQDRLEEADKRFKEIANAYEILSDKHERAWYDSHRDQILRSGSHQAGQEGFSGPQEPEDEIKLYQFFSASAYSGYNDGPQGFYTVYGDVFSQLYEQEVAAAEQAAPSGRSRSQPEEPPTFGKSDAEWAKVACFYSYWTNFGTAKDFAWAEEYNPAAAPNRKVRRLMEDENRKKRAALRREFNETVRELAAFVRKRDKRVAAHQAAEAQKKLQKEQEERERQEREKAARLERARQFQEPEWAAGRRGGGGAELSDSEEEDEDEPILDALHCLACDKIFKSEKAFQNHERSRKHLEAVEVLRAVLREEEAMALGLDLGTGTYDAADQTETDPEPEAQSGRRGKKKKKNARRQANGGGNGAREDGSATPAGSRASAPAVAGGGEQEPAPSASSAEVVASGGLREEAGGRRNEEIREQRERRGERQGRAVSKYDEQDEVSDEAADDASSRSGGASSAGEEMDEDEMLAQMMSNYGRGGGGSRAAEASGSSGDEEDDFVLVQSDDLRSAEEPEAGAAGDGSVADSEADDERDDDGLADMLSRANLQTADTSGTDVEEPEELPTSSQQRQQQQQQQPPVQKPQQRQGPSPERQSAAGATKKDKRRAKQAAKQGKAGGEAEQERVAQQASGTACMVCGEELGSRNALFKHIKTTGHAVLKR